MNKTERYLKLLWELSKSPEMRISENGLLEILGNPSRASFYRMINELIQGLGDLPPLLIKIEEEESHYFKLHIEGWNSLSTAQKEGIFYLECYKKLGHLLQSDYTKLVFDEDDSSLPQDAKKFNIKQKFIYLSKIQAKPFDQKTKKIFEKIIKSLLNDCEATISYKISGNAKIEKKKIRPLTLCHYRDDLYLLCYRFDNGEWIERTYKIQRMVDYELHEKDKFKYPTSTIWNPEEIFKKTSGIIRGPQQEVQLRIYGHSKNILREKLFYSSQILDEKLDYIEYRCIYTNADEFLGQLFIYAQDVEILSPKSIKDKFIDKASQAIQRNAKKNQAA